MHQPTCQWEKTTTAECEYRATHHYCPHPEHACTCAPARSPDADALATRKPSLHEHDEADAKWFESEIELLQIEDSQSGMAKAGPFLGRARLERFQRVLALIRSRLRAGEPSTEALLLQEVLDAMRLDRGDLFVPNCEIVRCADGDKRAALRRWLATASTGKGQPSSTEGVSLRPEEDSTVPASQPAAVEAPATESAKGIVDEILGWYEGKEVITRAPARGVPDAEPHVHHCLICGKDKLCLAGCLCRCGARTVVEFGGGGEWISDAEPPLVGQKDLTGMDELSVIAYVRKLERAVAAASRSSERPSDAAYEVVRQAIVDHMRHEDDCATRRGLDKAGEAYECDCVVMQMVTLLVTLENVADERSSERPGGPVTDKEVEAFLNHPSDFTADRLAAFLASRSSTEDRTAPMTEQQENEAIASTLRVDVAARLATRRSQGETPTEERNG